MEENDQNHPHTSSIPPIFWSDAEAAPFENCINCQCDLLSGEQPYMIEKAVRGFDGEKVSSTLFEYAVCINCAQEMNMKLSPQSKQRIEAYFRAHVNFQERFKRLHDQNDQAWLEECLIHQKGVSQDGECQLYALCQGNELIFHEFPYMIRAEALDEMMDLISAETLRQLDDFKDDLIDGPPELKELFEKGGPKVLL